MANSARFNIVSPIGRLVEGDPWKAQDKDGDGNLRVYKTGPNAGQPNPQFYVGLAVPKLINGQPNVDWANFYTFVEQVAKAAWPNLFPGGGACIAPNFAWKIRDGDGFVKQGKNAGKPLADKPGFAGHWIISFSSSFAPQLVVETSPGMYAEITDQEKLKRGFWVRIGASVSGNDSVQTPGLYMNLEKVELKGIGEVIQSGLSAAEAFSGAIAGAVPEGMQALPAGFTAGVASGLGGVAGAPQPGFVAPQPGAPQPGFVATNPGFAAPQPGFAAPPPPVAVPQPVAAPPAGRVMLAAAGATPYDAFIAQGWTDELLVANGMMAPTVPLAGPVPNAAPPSPGIASPGPGSTSAPIATISPSNAPPPPTPNAGFMGGVKVMLPAANGVTYDAYIAQGWNDAQLIANGLMAA